MLRQENGKILLNYTEFHPYADYHYEITEEDLKEVVGVSLRYLNDLEEEDNVEFNDLVDMIYLMFENRAYADFKEEIGASEYAKIQV